ncbi:MAG TPA: ribonuclease P protein component [Dehalococcoidia bacterium]|nr:ribonuclease P protein component [Dehalococcoidia bacterium]
MGKEERLRKNSEFTGVFERGGTWASEFVVLRAAPNGLEHNRYGFVTSKRLGNAVVRNRVKRLLREVTRTTPTTTGWDMVLIARGKAATASYRQIEAAVTRLLHRAQILINTN